MQNRVIRSVALVSALVLPLLPLSPNLEAQQALRSAENRSAENTAKPTPPAASAPTSVPALVPYAGFGVGADGKPITGEVPVTFLIFKDENGGEPLFIESQTAAFDATGHYEAQLGATLSSGIPIALFGTGEARWLEVQIAGAKVQPRALLVSVPYALKAGDASTLGGLPASAYALAGVSKTTTAAATTSIAAAGVTPDAGTDVTTTGGTSGYLPVFNGGATVIDSILFQGSSGIGIGDTPNSAYKLDVNGKSIFRGAAGLPSNGSATSSAGTNSYPLSLSASAYNSSTKADVAPTFYLQAEPTNNDTSGPSATINLLYNGTDGTGSETGLYIYQNGFVHFSGSQTFAATSSSVAFNGNSTGGLGVEGTSTSGSGVQGNSTSSNGVYGKSSTGNGLQGLTAGTTTHTAGVYGVAGTANTSGFTGIAGVWGDANASVGVFGSSTKYSGVDGVSASSFGVQGTSSSSYGVIGTTYASSGAAAGVYGYSSSGTPGVKGASATSDGGDFYGGGDGYGIQAVGGSSNGIGIGGNFTGGPAIDGVGEGGIGMYATGGAGSDEDNAGSGVVAFGGYGNDEDGGTGGVFNGGDTYDGNGGYGVYVSAGGSEEQGSKDAGYFAGDVEITGALNGSTAGVRIDHPLDPANKYLSQASIASSEMLNIYSGNVITDEQGLATVQLPTWFEAVNGDLRYQLTMIGHKGQAWISQEVKEGKFQISSDAANAKVSWQITGVRQDAYAKAHPLVVEQEKDARARGFYQSPELYGQPRQKQTEWALHPGTMHTIEVARAKNKRVLAAAK